MCNAFEGKEICFLEIKNIIYELDTAIKKEWSTPMKFRNLDLHELFIKTLFWINLCPVKN